MVDQSLTTTSNQEVLKQLVTVVQQLSLARDLDTVTKIVRKAARELTGADGATFVLKERDLCFYADEDAISPLWKGSRFPMSTCISGWAMINRKAAVIEDIYLDDRIPIDAYRPTFVKSLAMVPIRTIEPIGAIGNYWAHQHCPSENEVALLQSLADITAVTLENVRIYSELEQRVKERTQQLEAVNHELEAFSYSVSHDLRAPLRSIIGYANVIKEDNLDNLTNDGKAALNIVLQNATRMGTLIDDLLEFSKLDKKDLQKIDVAMHDLVKQSISTLADTSCKASFKVDPLPSVSCDAVLLHQVWHNLLSNAIKYSSKKENSTIEVGSYEKETQIVFYVKDNGAGFNMTYVHKLFDAFQRLHTTREFEGNGIGLSLVKKIITKHGGHVWAEGKVNEGATFFFSLPKE